VLVLVGVQFQGAVRGVGDGRAGAGLLAALKAGVVLDTDPGERRDFLPAQARGAAHPGSRGEADVGRVDMAAPGAQETSRFRPAAVVLLRCHATSVPRHGSRAAGRGEPCRTPAGYSPEQAALPPCRRTRQAGSMTDSGKTRAQQLLGDTAPDLVRLTDEVLFGQVWADPGLSQRDRSLVTVAALVSLNRTGQLGSHLRRALGNGLSKDELVHAITHLAFYAGWPNAMSALTRAREMFVKK